MSTIQVDLMLPQRFDSSHRLRWREALAGDDPLGTVRIFVERFFAVLLEHYAGAVPRMAGAGARGAARGREPPDYAQELAAELRGHGFRVEVAAAEDTPRARIRRAKGQKLPYVLWSATTWRTGPSG
ncbi:MAG: His/Gly/Thr/Pro-type tRNA ligase C-terminal domain-containing protein [Microthrixaceae bacterium]